MAHHPAYASVHERIQAMRLDHMDSFSIVDPDWDDTHNYDGSRIIEEFNGTSDLEEEARIKEAGHVW